MRLLVAVCLLLAAAGPGRAEEDLKTLNARVAELYRNGDFIEGAAAAERAFERTFGKETTETANALGGFAKLFYDNGNYVFAEPLFRRALAIDEKALGDDHPDTAIDLNNLAAVYLAQGRYANAEPLFKRALTIKEKALGPDHADVAATLNNLAGLYQLQGLYAAAEPLLKRALAIHEKSSGPEHPDTAPSLNNLAAVYDKQGKYALAESLYKRALAIYEKHSGPDHPDTARTLNNLAFLSKLQGRYAISESLYKKALASRERSLGPDHPETAQSLNNLAVLYDAQGRFAQAEPLYRRALAILVEFPGPDHPSTISTFMGLASAEAALGRFREAAKLADSARRGTRRHVTRVLPSLSAAEQSAFLRTQDEGHFHASLTLGLFHRSTPSLASLSAGWLANGKAVGQEAAARQILLARQSANPATKAAVASLEKVRGDLAKLSQMTPSSEQAAALRTKIASLHEVERTLVHEIGGQLAALDRDEPWIEIDAIRKNIPAGSVLVDIARFDVFDFTAQGKGVRWQPARYAAWIVPPAGAGDVTIVDLGAAEEIDAAVKSYREAIEAVQKGGFKRGQATAEDELKVTAAPLTTKVLQPIADAIGPATDIILSPDGSLWLVPWQALPMADGTYAIERFSIRTVTSARDLVPVSVQAKGSRGGAIVVADPAFDTAPAASGKPSADTSRSLAPSNLAQKFPPLKGTRAEALATTPAIAKLTGGEPMMLLGTEACETNVKRAAIRPRSLILATHGFFKEDPKEKKDDEAGSPLASSGGRGGSPEEATTGELLEDPLLRCGLALAGANLAAKATGGDDGVLTGAEIVGLDLLGTDLVVLSACETGVGQVQNGEGVAGLRQAFQIAGAKSVVATLWQVPDAESAAIMASFYGNLSNGLPVSKALREAQLAFVKARREDRNYEAAHPYLWAAYGVTGR